MGHVIHCHSFPVLLMLCLPFSIVDNRLERGLFWKSILPRLVHVFNLTTYTPRLDPTSRLPCRD